MKERKLIYPRRMVNIMTKFINEASDLTEINSYFKGNPNTTNDNNWFEEVFLNDSNWIDVEEKINIRIHKISDINFNADIDNYVIGYNLKTLYDNSSLFRKDITDKHPFIKGFADITITLLHELGHLETENEVSAEYNRENAQKENFSMVLAILKEEENISNKEELKSFVAKNSTNYKKVNGLFNHLYHQLEDEYLATQWAINWLEDSKNRKIAKAFEKKFFACFEKKA